MGHLKISGTGVLVLLAILLLAGCSAAVNQAIDTAEAIGEKRVDNTVIRGVNRICKAPIDITMRAAVTFPAVIPFLVKSCPATYGALSVLLVDNAADQAPSQVTINVDMETIRELLSRPAAPIEPVTIVPLPPPQ